MKLGAYTACLHDHTLAEALDVLRANGLTSAEVNSGGFLPAPHCPVDLLLSSATARREYLAEFAERDMELTALNCNGNPLNPLPGVGPKHAEDLRRSIRLAGQLGVRHVVTMSGTPGSDPDAKYPSWVVNPWDGVYLDVRTTNGMSRPSSGTRSTRWRGRTACGSRSKCIRTTWPSRR